MLFNLPNIISMIRVLIAPLFIVLMLTDDPGYIILGCFVYLLAATSDYIDGWYARKFGMVTKWGQFFDPLADKVLTISAFIVFYIFDIIPLWMVGVIVLRDVVTTVFRIVAISKKSVLETSYPAKFKTSVQMIFIAFILVLLFIKYTGVFDILPETVDKIIYSDWTYYTMLLLTLLTVWTLMDYIFRNKSLLSKIWSDCTKKNLLMNKFFYKLKIALLSFLGIGFIPWFREFFAALAAMVLVLLIPDAEKTVILIFLIIIFLLFFEITGFADSEEIINEKFVFRRVLGIWISVISPYVLVTLFWAGISSMIYYLFLFILDSNKIMNWQCKNPKCEFLKKDIMAGVMALVTIQILYSAASLLPFIYLFFNR